MREPAARELRAFNFRRWIDEHRHLLKPPVGNKQVFTDSEFIIMVVGGPNSRKDFHVDPGEEFFYQLEGDMVLMVDGQPPKPLKAGESYQIPSGAIHDAKSGAGGAKVLAVYVVQKGQPLASPAK